MIPTIDPQVKYLGTSYLRTLNSETMKAMEGAVVIQDADAEPLVVIVPFATYLRLQVASVTNGNHPGLLPATAPAEAAKPSKKPNREQRAIAERAAGDIGAQEAGREDIDYADTESTPTVNVAKLRGTAGAMSAATKKTTENWRENRKPLLKPKEQK